MNDDWYCSPTTEESLPIFLYPGAWLSAKVWTWVVRRNGSNVWADGNWTSGKVFFHSNTWSATQNHYNYFSDLQNGYIDNTNDDIICIPSVDTEGIDNTEKNILKASQKVEPGDLVYWINNEEGVHHATIVTDVKNGQIMIAGNTKAYSDELVADRMKENSAESIIIVHLKDECFN